MACFGSIFSLKLFWVVLVQFGFHLGYLGLYWLVLVGFGSFWQVLACFGSLRPFSVFIGEF